MSGLASPWSGVLLMLVAALVFGLWPAGVFIGLAVAGLVLDRLAPGRLDRLIELLRS